MESELHRCLTEMGNLGFDLRIALRMLRKNPAFTAVAVLTLGLGIAANTAVFSWVDAILLRPVPGVPEPERLVAIEAISPEGARLGSLTHPEFREFQRDLKLASGVFAAHAGFFTVGSSQSPRRVVGQAVSANFFSVLGVHPFLGRLFLPQEDRDDKSAYPLAVISYGFWRSAFNGDRLAIGRPVRINGHQLTLVGVAPPDFQGSVGGLHMDVWVPLSIITDMGALNTWAAADWNARFLDVTARLKPGVTIERVRAEAQAVAARTALAHPNTHRGVSSVVIPIRLASSGLMQTLRDPLRILMAACILVLLIACANVANLLMARSLSRNREFGVRMALGAARGRLIGQLALEVLLVAGGGAACGLLLASWLGGAMSYAIPALDPMLQAVVSPLLEPQIGGAAMLFAALLSVAAALAATVFPAISLNSLDLSGTLKEGGRTGTSGVASTRARTALVIAEVALASMALVGAGVALRTFQRIAAIHPGFEANGVLVAQFYLSSNGYSLEREKKFSRDLRTLLESSPGIEQAVSADAVPLSILGSAAERIQVDGSVPDRGGVNTVRRAVVQPGYFNLMRIPLLEGRDFTDQDEGGKPRVIVVNQSFARKYFGTRSPIGRKVRVSGVPSTVVGLVKDTKYRSPNEGRVPYFYGSFRQVFFSGNNHFLLVRAGGDLDSAAVAVRRAVASLDPSGGLYNAMPLTAHTEAGMFAERVAASLLTALSLLALALAAIGLYSVMAYSVNERRQEIGIRMALGAQRIRVLGMVLGKGLSMTAAGLAAGIAAALVAARVLSTGLDAPLAAAEPAAIGAASGVLLAVALIACCFPARRATRLDPMSTLRSD
jgi:predicted permease